VPVTLSVAQPYASVALQIGYGYLSVTAADGKGYCYDETQTYHTYSLTYINPGNLQQDATLLYNQQASTLPPGWAVIFDSAVLKAGQSTQLVVQTAPWTVFGDVTVTVTAICNSVSLAAAPIVLMQKWQPEIQLYYAPQSCNTYSLYLNFLCVDCSDSGESVAEKFIGDAARGLGCSSSGSATLTDAVSVPDGNGPAIVSGDSCIPSGTLTCSTTFQNGQTYTFSMDSGCGGIYSSVTITPSMLQ
jgi:hypothetical protein